MIKKMAAVKILRSLSPGDNKFTETINIDIKNVRDSRPWLYYRDIPNIDTHQKASYKRRAYFKGDCPTFLLQTIPVPK
jgi:hypothetical protein